MSATAVDGYVRPHDRDGSLKSSTYIFTPGHFFASGTKDKSVDGLQFLDVAKTVAVGLAKQAYMPSPDPEAAELAIVLHWGTTLIHEGEGKQEAMDRLNRALQEYREMPQNRSTIPEGRDHGDPSAIAHATDMLTSGQEAQATAEVRNAALLGYTRTMDRTLSTTDLMTMKLELSEERYFVVLMAYDYQYMKREHKPRLLWVTRISIRSPGYNFAEALPALIRAGGEQFGVKSDGLKRKRIDPRRAVVELGESVIVETTNPAARTN